MKSDTILLTLVGALVTGIATGGTIYAANKVEQKLVKKPSKVTQIKDQIKDLEFEIEKHKYVRKVTRNAEIELEKFIIESTTGKSTQEIVDDPNFDAKDASEQLAVQQQARLQNDVVMYRKMAELKFLYEELDKIEESQRPKTFEERWRSD